LGMIPLIFMGGWTGYGIYQAASVLVPVGFLQFSQHMESEADLLGLEYMYKAGYDPTAFVDFFEKIETLEKRKPGTMAKVFSTHPPTDARIRASQKNINDYLKAKPEYVVTTSEFNDVRSRLMAMHNKRKIDNPADANKPTLRRAPGSTGGTVGDDGANGGSSTSTDDDDRPTLKRRPSSDN
jgi:beta-barrel assembly-enhancing protease